MHKAHRHAKESNPRTDLKSIGHIECHSEMALAEWALARHNLGGYWRRHSDFPTACSPKLRFWQKTELSCQKSCCCGVRLQAMNFSEGARCAVDNVEMPQQGGDARIHPVHTSDNVQLCCQSSGHLCS